MFETKVGGRGPNHDEHISFFLLELKVEVLLGGWRKRLSPFFVCVFSFQGALPLLFFLSLSVKKGLSEFEHQLISLVDA